MAAVKAKEKNPALRVMLDDHAYGLSRRRVTVSTSGVVPMIDRLREDCPVALAVSLHQRGLFSWPEWAAALAAQIATAQAAGDNDLGDTYYRHWLSALEALVAAKGAARADELARCARAWDHAAERTPHGQPITLRPDDFSA